MFSGNERWLQFLITSSAGFLLEAQIVLWRSRVRHWSLSSCGRWLLCSTWKLLFSVATVTRHLTVSAPGYSESPAVSPPALAISPYTVLLRRWHFSVNLLNQSLLIQTFFLQLPRLSHPSQKWTVRTFLWTRLWLEGLWRLAWSTWTTEHLFLHGSSKGALVSSSSFADWSSTSHILNSFSLHLHLADWCKRPRIRLVLAFSMPSSLSLIVPGFLFKVRSIQFLHLLRCLEAIANSPNFNIFAYQRIGKPK